MENISSIQARTEELETKLMFQDDLIDNLNQSLILQQQDIIRLTRIVDSMSAQLKDLKQPSVIDASLETPPPHY